MCLTPPTLPNPPPSSPVFALSNPFSSPVSSQSSTPLYQSNSQPSTPLHFSNPGIQFSVASPKRTLTRSNWDEEDSPPEIFPDLANSVPPTDVMITNRKDRTRLIGHNRTNSNDEDIFSFVPDSPPLTHNSDASSPAEPCVTPLTQRSPQVISPRINIGTRNQVTDTNDPSKLNLMRFPSAEGYNLDRLNYRKLRKSKSEIRVQGKVEDIDFSGIPDLPETPQVPDEKDTKPTTDPSWTKSPRARSSRKQPLGVNRDNTGIITKKIYNSIKTTSEGWAVIYPLKGGTTKTSSKDHSIQSLKQEIQQATEMVLCFLKYHLEFFFIIYYPENYHGNFQPNGILATITETLDLDNDIQISITSPEELTHDCLAREATKYNIYI